MDTEMLEARLLDWFSMVRQQQAVLETFDLEALGRKIMAAELEAGLAMASPQALVNAEKRIRVLHQDREKRFGILKEVVEQVALREMNLDIVLSPPDKYQPLVLRQTNALGVFGEAMLIAGETLPIG